MVSNEICCVLCFVLFLVVCRFAWKHYKRRREGSTSQFVPYKVVKPPSSMIAEHETALGKERKRVVAVVGGTGFIGSHVVDELVRRGEYYVFVLGRKFRPERTNPNADCLIQVDVLEVDGLVKAFQGIDSVINTAAILPTVYSSASEMYNKNRIAFNNILMAAKKAGVKTLIHLTGYHMETKAMQPWPVTVSLMNIFKASEKDVLAANGKDGLQTCVIAPANVLGLNSNHFDQIVSGEMKWFPMSDVKHTSFLPVEYLTAAIANAERKLSTPGGSEGIAGKFLPLKGEQMSWRDLLTQPGWLQKISPLPFFVMNVSIKINSTCAALLGWAPFGSDLSPLIIDLLNFTEAEVPEEEIQEVYRVLEVGPPHPPVADYIKQMVQRYKDKQEQEKEANKKSQ